MTPEGSVVKACLDMLAFNNVPAWRNNTGATTSTYKGKTRFVRYGAVGSPDIFAIMPGGVLLGIECKAGKGKPTDEQRLFGQMMTDAGAVWIVVHDVAELLAELDKRGVTCPPTSCSPSAWFRK